MKKCPYCGAQIADDSRFCSECGKEYPQGSVCPHCGASVGEGDVFCQNCGKNLKEVFTNEPITYEEERPKRGFKKYLPYILGAFVLLVIIGYYNAKDSNGKNDTQTAVSDTLSVNNGFATEDNHSSKDFIMKRLDDIFDDVVKGNIIGSDDGYFTKEFVSLYNQVDKIDESADGIGFWDGGFWGQQFDETIKKVEVNKIFDITENKAKVSVVFRVFADGHTMAIPDTLGLVYERDDWYIDELHHYKRDMKAYIQSNPQSDTEGNQVGNSDGANETYSSSSNTSSSSRTFYSEQIVIGYLANQSFRESDGLTMRVDGDGRLYVDGNYAGVLSVLRYSSTAALLRYGGGMYGEGKLTVNIVGDKFTLTDPTDGTVYYQR